MYPYRLFHAFGWQRGPEPWGTTESYRSSTVVDLADLPRSRYFSTPLHERPIPCPPADRHSLVRKSWPRTPSTITSNPNDTASSVRSLCEQVPRARFFLLIVDFHRSSEEVRSLHVHLTESNMLIDFVNQEEPRTALPRILPPSLPRMLPPSLSQILPSSLPVVLSRSSSVAPGGSSPVAPNNTSSVAHDDPASEVEILPPLEPLPSLPSVSGTYYVPVSPGTLGATIQPVSSDSTHPIASNSGT